MVIRIGEFLKNIPKYITTNPIKIKLRAKVRILLILLEYFFAIQIPSLKLNYIVYFFKNESFCLKKLSIFRIYKLDESLVVFIRFMINLKEIIFFRRKYKG